MKGSIFYFNRFVSSVILALSSAILPSVLCADDSQNSAVLTEAEPKLLITTPKMRNETALLGLCLEKGHFSKVRIDELDVREFVREYMEGLDFFKMIFLATDVQYYQDTFSSMMPTLLHQGILLPANKIYHETFVPRAQSRLEWIRNRLQQPFDFASNKTFSPDRSKASWPLDMKEADELWDKRITYDVLNQIISYDHEENSVDSEIVEALDEDAAKTAKAVKESEKEAKKLAEESSPKTFEEKLEKAKSEVLRRYEGLISNVIKDDAMEIQEIYLNALASMYDPHSSFLSEYALEDFNISMINKLFGIGATLTEKDGYCEVVELVPGGPADKLNKLQPGDKILAVAQDNGEFKDVIGHKLRNTVRLIRGKAGSVVRLQVEPKVSPGVRNTISIVREEIQLTTKLAKANIYEVPVDNQSILVGVIDLPAFYGENSFDDDTTGFSATKNVEELIEKLKQKNVKAIILDFRKNGGGLLPEAVNLAGLFIRTGPVLQVKDIRGVSSPLRDEDPKVVWDGPLMVLVSSISASAAEIVTGALQNHERAIVVGDVNTYGKGTVQSVFNLSNFDAQQKSAAKVTVQKWYLPNGESIQVKGVKSDIHVPSILETMDLGEVKKDRVLAWDFIDPVSIRAGYGYGAGDKGKALLETLKNKSLERQKTLDEFKFLDDRMAWFKARQDKKEWSLNLKEREEMLAKDEAYVEEMKKRQKEFEKQNFKSEEILLDSAIEKKAQEDAAKAEKEKAKAENSPDSKTADESSKKKSDEKENEVGFDIQLREALRIMADFVVEQKK